MSNRTVAFIPVRGGSKSIPLKNIKEFCGKPLVYWVIKAASECKMIDEVFVATDNDDISAVVNSFSFSNVSVIKRSPETATDTASTETAVIEFAQTQLFENVILIQATSPLLESSDLAGGIDKYLLNKSDSLLSVVRQQRFIWKESSEGAVPVNYDPANRPRRQDWSGYLVENGAFYITTRTALLSTGLRISGQIDVYEMDQASYFEIDEPSDWVIAERLKKKYLNTMHDFDLKKINLLVCDVDGVLTDGGMYYSTDGSESKKFNARDGMGISLLRKTGVKVMFMTSEENRIIEDRAKKLNIDFLYMGIKDKKNKLDEFYRTNLDYAYTKTAYIGDDLNDENALRNVFFSCAPSDAIDQIKQVVAYVCFSKGGDGCVREVCDIIMTGGNDAVAFDRNN